MVKIKKNPLAVFILVLFFSYTANAEEKGKVEKIIQSMKESGAYDATLSRGLDYDRGYEELRVAAHSTYGGGIDSFGEKYKSIEKAAYEKMLEELKPLEASAEGILLKRLNLIADGLTQDEIDQINKFNRSEVGKKYSAVMLRVDEKMYEFGELKSKEWGEAYQRAAKKYNERIYVHQLMLPPPKNQ